MTDMSRALKGLSRRPGATIAALAESEQHLGVKLPEEYAEFLRTTNGAEGFVGAQSYVVLWGTDELASINKEYEAHKHAPGLLVFGSDGGGEAYGFDTRKQKWPIVKVPFIGMDWNAAIPIGDSFNEFLTRLYTLGLD